MSWIVHWCCEWLDLSLLLNKITLPYFLSVKPILLQFLPLLTVVYWNNLPNILIYTFFPLFCASYSRSIASHLSAKHFSVQMLGHVIYWWNCTKFCGSQYLRRQIGFLCVQMRQCLKSCLQIQNAKQWNAQILIYANGFLKNLFQNFLIATVKLLILTFFICLQQHYQLSHFHLAVIPS